MPIAKTHKNATRARIVEGAGRLFRRFGPAAVTIDQVMAEADLTRGGFYAYFDSKAELFDAVVEDQELLARVNGCTGATKRHRRKAVLKVLEAYLNPANVQANAEACGFVALGSDVARADSGCSRVFADKLDALGEAIGAVLPSSAGKDHGHAIAAQTIGALYLARACGDAGVADRVLTAALAELRRSLA